MKGFIEVTTLNTVTRMSSERNCFGDYEEIKSTIEEKELINLYDIARVYTYGIVLKTAYPNGDSFVRAKESYEEIKRLIKQAL